jgi:hypothetical protein
LIVVTVVAGVVVLVVVGAVVGVVEVVEVLLPEEAVVETPPTPVQAEMTSNEQMSIRRMKRQVMSRFPQL